jgi:hypothetical protein
MSCRGQQLDTCASYLGYPYKKLLSKNISHCPFCRLRLVIAALFERRAFVLCRREEREKGISRSPVQGNSKVEASEVKSEVIRVSRHLAVLTI